MCYRQHHEAIDKGDANVVYESSRSDLRRTIEALESECVSVDTVVEENSSELKLCERLHTRRGDVQFISNRDAKYYCSLVQSRSEMKI